MINIAVCEDDYVYTEMIDSILQSCITVPFHIEFFSSGTEFLNTLTEHGCPYTLIITDINLGGHSVNGITVAKRVNKLNSATQVIFVSQYLDFASDVYETAHVYFVNKQRIREYLPKALQAVHKKFLMRSDHFLYFQSSYKEYQVAQADILYLEHISRQTCIHTPSQVYSTYEKLQDLTSRLSSEFCSCHKSFAVNLYQVEALHHSSILLRNGTTIPVSRSHYPRVREAFAKFVTQNQQEATL
ncbi:LytR/AlgR family response regulator transcription factor [Blautia sp. MSJ-19]|uniref:LytR/AlgR family response regulator transcription factor n=1 Tax=Blautia sp. MSJ-19 TaxID=2841517 RepID=UPI001C0ECBE3|nr:LytTR family DNA-binding domain-containing protein [Blautia sp. MSJ-19]MBU5480793.1 LytTR family DNA-binding domain-containing protein [Blautia sp. MSJ-19]